jgi:hypothetical protein
MGDASEEIVKKAHLSAFPRRAGSADDVINHKRRECMLIIQSRRMDGRLTACRDERGMSSTLPVCRFHVITTTLDGRHVLCGQSRTSFHIFFVSVPA